MSDRPIHDAVREKYGDIARSVGKTGCCGSTAGGCGDPITSSLYSETEKAGQTVLDLGSGSS
jgi:bacterioferritin-associated ferredoxin